MNTTASWLISKVTSTPIVCRAPFLVCVLAILLVLPLASHAAPQSTDMQVLGLFKNAALLKVGREQKLVKVGQKWKGISVIEADSKQAIVSVNGKEQTVTVSQHISSNYAKPTGQTFSIPRNDYRQYITTAQINGKSTKVLVDTGANIVALSSVHAKSMNIPYEKGVPGRVQTASGVVRSYTVMLDKVDVGGIIANNVQASVLDGAYPATVLLGMSYLQHVEMQEKNGILMLIRKY